MPSVAIIGAGMAGLSCASVLTENGWTVTLFDKARRAGGRMASRKLETAHGPAMFDFGAQYFTVRDPGFAAEVARWAEAGLASRWPDAREDAWIGTPTMNTVMQAMAAPYEVHYSHHVSGLARENGRWRLLGDGMPAEHFDAAVLALPAEQAAPMLTLHDFDLARTALFARSQPCWTGMFAFDTPLAHHEHTVRDHGILAWAARNNAKPGRAGPESWVVQATPQWSTTHLERTPDEIGPLLLAALGEATGGPLPAPLAHSIHRWRYALSAGTGARLPVERGAAHRRLRRLAARAPSRMCLGIGPHARRTHAGRSARSSLKKIVPPSPHLPSSRPSQPALRSRPHTIVNILQPADSWPGRAACYPGQPQCRVYILAGFPGEGTRVSRARTPHMTDIFKFVVTGDTIDAFKLDDGEQEVVGLR